MTVRHILLIARSGLISGSDINTHTPHIYIRTRAYACIHTCTYTHTRLPVMHMAANSVCVPTCGTVVVVIVGSQMLIAYACITRVCTQTRADDIPVIRVANYICRCPAREGRDAPVSDTRVHARVACMYVRPRGFPRTNKMHTRVSVHTLVIPGTYVAHICPSRRCRCGTYCVRACVRARNHARSKRESGSPG